jgi:hypothetical protein
MLKLEKLNVISTKKEAKRRREEGYYLGDIMGKK